MTMEYKDRKKISKAASKFKILTKFCYNAHIKEEEIGWQVRLLEIARNELQGRDNFTDL